MTQICSAACISQTLIALPRHKAGAMMKHTMWTGVASPSAFSIYRSIVKRPWFCWHPKSSAHFADVRHADIIAPYWASPFCGVRMVPWTLKPRLRKARTNPQRDKTNIGTGVPGSAKDQYVDQYLDAFSHSFQVIYNLCYTKSSVRSRRWPWEIYLSLLFIDRRSGTSGKVGRAEERLDPLPAFQTLVAFSEWPKATIHLLAFRSPFAPSPSTLSSSWSSSSSMKTIHKRLYTVLPRSAVSSPLHLLHALPSPESAPTLLLVPCTPSTLHIPSLSSMLHHNLLPPLDLATPISSSLVLLQRPRQRSRQIRCIPIILARMPLRLKISLPAPLLVFGFDFWPVRIIEFSFLQSEPLLSLPVFLYAFRLHLYFCRPRHPDHPSKRQRTRYQLDVGAYGIPKRSCGACVAGRDGQGKMGFVGGIRSRNDQPRTLLARCRSAKMRILSTTMPWASQMALGLVQAAPHRSDVATMSEEDDLCAELEDSLEELEDGLDVLMILERAFEKTLQSHVRHRSDDTPACSPPPCGPGDGGRCQL
ncbi:hypothetical protein A0H81_06949 [Grifola frondosa]|uniref:Uncharacterized protein n=1 Tax=Grifola frondosa TaxID=5627 RepID=A0A1C7M7E8_GRIFR|nr:hypothetical protein A0H81_06949 [Grifola frondosa]